MQILLTILTLVLLSGCSSKFENDRDKMSYALGRQIGESLKKDNPELNAKVIALAIREAYDDKAASLPPPELAAAIHLLQTSVQKRYAEKAEKNEKTSRGFLDSNRNRPGVKVTASGLQYEVVHEGKGAKPKEKDNVVVKYVGKLVTGETFDSSERTGKPAEFGMAQVIPGFREALSLMSEGSVYRVAMPPELAYGSRERPGIPAQSVLVFEIELVQVKK